MNRRASDQFAAIKTMLSIWGRWAIRSSSRALGYPSVSPMFRDAPSGDGFGSQIPAGVTFDVGPDIYRLDEDIKRLPIVQRVAIVEVYQVGGSFRQVAERMGVKRDALGNWLEKAHSALTIVIDNHKTGGHNPAQSPNVVNCASETPGRFR